MNTDLDFKKPVFIIDDDEIILNVLSLIIGKLGFKSVVQATDGQKALVKILKTDPSLIITDIDMPVMNGIQLVQQIRKKPVYKHVPIVALTGNATREMVVKAFKSGVDAYLIKKEIKEEEVQQKILEAVEFRREKLCKNPE